MKSSKILICSAALAMGAMMAWAATPTATSATATVRAGQGMQQMSPADRAKARVDAIDKAVGGLSDDVKTKMSAIYEKAYTDSAAARASGDSDAMQKSRAITTQADTDAKALLTPDQVAKWPAGRGRRGGGGGGGF